MVGLEISLKWIYPEFCILNSNRNTTDLTLLLSNYLSTHTHTHTHRPKTQACRGKRSFTIPCWYKSVSVCYQPPCHTRFRLPNLFKILTAKILLRRWEQLIIARAPDHGCTRDVPRFFSYETAHHVNLASDPPSRLELPGSYELWYARSLNGNCLTVKKFGTWWEQLWELSSSWRSDRP